MTTDAKETVQVQTMPNDLILGTLAPKNSPDISGITNEARRKRNLENAGLEINPCQYYDVFDPLDQIGITNQATQTSGTYFEWMFIESPEEMFRARKAVDDAENAFWVKWWTDEIAVMKIDNF